MHTCIAVVTTLVFLIWLLPLGVFIKPSVEKIACDGKRAVCMCSHASNKSKPFEAGVMLKASSETNKESNAPSVGTYFLASHHNHDLNNRLRIHNFDQQQLYSLLVSRTLDHVPKA